jgi:hypothetical protein
MATHRISVTVDDASIRVTPETLTMTSDDEVHWAGTNPRRFSIVFEKESPFETRELAHDQAASKRRARSKGRFKYVVVSADDPGLRLDPVIIVDDPPSGPHP